MTTLENLKALIAQEKEAIKQLQAAENSAIEEAQAELDKLMEQRAGLEGTVVIDQQLVDATLTDVDARLGQQADIVLTSGDTVITILPADENDTNIFNRVRSAFIDGERWFVGTDVARKLKFSNASDAVSKYVAKRQRAVALMEDGKKRRLRFITAEGVGELVNRGRNEFADDYAAWLSTIVERVETSDEVDDLVSLQEEVKQLRARLSILDEFQDESGTVNISVIASRYKLSARELNTLLAQSNVQRYDRSAQCWRITPGHETYAKLVLTLGSAGFKKYTLRWTLAGELFIDEVLRRDHGFEGFDINLHNIPS